MKTTEFGKIEAVKFCDSKFQKPGQKAVLLRQEVTTVYSGGTPGELSLLPKSEKRFPTTRYLVMPCADDVTLEQLTQSKVLRAGKIGRIIASEPIVLPKHEWAMANTDLTLDDIAESQLIPMLDDDDNAVLDATGNKVPMLDNYGWPMFKVHRLVKSDVEDVDTRFQVPAPAEVAGAMTEAEIDTQALDV